MLFTLIFSRRYKDIIIISGEFFKAINIIKNTWDSKVHDWRIKGAEKTLEEIGLTYFFFVDFQTYEKYVKLCLFVTVYD